MRLIGSPSAKMEGVCLVYCGSLGSMTSKYKTLLRTQPNRLSSPGGEQDHVLHKENVAETAMSPVQLICTAICKFGCVVYRSWHCWRMGRMQGSRASMGRVQQNGPRLAGHAEVAAILQEHIDSEQAALRVAAEAAALSDYQVPTPLLSIEGNDVALCCWNLRQLQSFQ